MGVELLGSSGVFAERFGQCAAEVERWVDWSVVEALGDGGLLGRIDVVQPVLFAVQVGLAAVWEGLGVVPSAVVGHSQGEIAAACVAGALTLGDGARLVVERSGLFARELVGRGAVASVGLGREQVQARLGGFAGLVVAGVNGPSVTTVAGDVGVLGELVAVLEGEGVRARVVEASVASHSPQVERLRGRLVESLGFVRPVSGRVPLYSTVSGGVVDGADLGAGYWFDNCRSPVEFCAAVQALLADGFGVFVEPSAHPVLVMGVQEIAEAAGGEVVAVGSLRRGEGGLERLYTSVGQAWAQGVQVDWSPVLGGYDQVDLPTYPFQRQRHWVRSRRTSTARSGRPDSWRYRVAWRPLGEPAQAEPTGDWIIVEPAGHPGEDVVTALERRGARTIRIAVDATAPSDTEAARRLRTALDGEVHGVVSLLAGSDADLSGTLMLIRTLAESGAETPLWTLTRGAVAATGTDAPVDPAQARVWGLGQVAALEHPRLWRGLIDLPAEPDERVLSLLAAVLAGPGGEDQIAVRPAGILARRVVPAPLGDRPARRAWRPRGTILVTGGTRGEGAEVARWLAREGAERLLLTTEPGTPPGHAAELVAELSESGVSVSVVPCDAADRDALAEVLAQVSLTAVFHTAGRLEEGPLESFAAETVEAVLRAKATAAQNLHELTLGAELSAFVMFSSFTATFGGGVGVGVYAAANAYLDALAAYRRGLGLPATSLAWGAWANPGGTKEEADFEALRAARLVERGLPALEPSLALTALRQALDHDETAVTLVEVDWERFARRFTATRPSPLLGEIPEAARYGPAAGRAGAAATPGAATRLTGAPGPERLRQVLDLVRGQVAAVLGHASADAVDPRRGLLELGMDSLTMVELRNRLSAATGLRVRGNLVVSAGTPEAIARMLDAELGEEGVSEDAPHGGAFGALFAHARESGRLAPFTGLLADAARFRPEFGAAEPDLPEPTVLVRGGGRPRLICLPTVLATSGPHQYARLAARLRSGDGATEGGRAGAGEGGAEDGGSGEREITAFALPGFRNGERLPASLEALVEATVEAVRGHAEGEPFVLLGYSSGGILARFAAARLEELGVRPDGLVLVDSYPIDEDFLERTAPGVLSAMAERAEGVMPLDDDRLTAMGAYLRLLIGREPKPVTAPTLLVAAAEPIAGAAGLDRAGTPADDRVEVPGDHFSVIEEHVATTAQAVAEWLSRNATMPKETMAQWETRPQ
ncbi:type I polyketide synthase [Sphaerisporangium flaviroseum]|uniref:type I polyketide synthase n=1 Tax=Sphaerisporangium flaviroseum TaxID=509199 RepID=UPI0031F0FC9D